MATYSQLVDALKRADAAGAADDARALAAALKSGQYREAQQAQMPTAAESVSGPEAALIGAGRGLTRIGRGISDLFLRGAGFTPEGPLLSGIREREESEAPGHQALQQERPGATMLGEMAPYLATAPISLGSGLAGMAATGAALPALEYQADPTDRLKAAGLGAAGGLAGGLLGAAAGRVLRPVSETAQEGLSSVAQRARGLGLRTTPAVESGSKALGQVEASIASSPFASSALSGLKSTNQATANRIAAESIGETAENVSSEVLDRAARRIGSEFEAVADIPAVGLGDDFAARIAGIETELGDAILQDYARPAVEKAIQAAKNAAAGGTVTGRQALDFTSRLGKQSRTLFRGAKSDPEAAQILGAVKDAMDDAVVRSAGPDMGQRLASAREQWRNLLALERPGVIGDPITGDISVASLANAMRQQGGSSFMRGRQTGQLAELGAVGKAMRPVVGDSGTATRMALPMLGIGGTMGAISGGDIEGAAGGAATGLGLGVALPWLLGRGYTSPAMRAYMTRGLLPIDETQRALLTGASRGLGAGLLTRD